MGMTKYTNEICLAYFTVVILWQGCAGVLMIHTGHSTWLSSRMLTSWDIVIRKLHNSTQLWHTAPQLLRPVSCYSSNQIIYHWLSSSKDGITLWHYNYSNAITLHLIESTAWQPLEGNCEYSQPDYGLRRTHDRKQYQSRLEYDGEDEVILGQDDQWSNPSISQITVLI